MTRVDIRQRRRPIALGLRASWGHPGPAAPSVVHLAPPPVVAPPRPVAPAPSAISGLVQAEDGLPMSAQGISVPELGLDIQTDPAGGFLLQVKPGRYRLPHTRPTGSCPRADRNQRWRRRAAHLQHRPSAGAESDQPNHRDHRRNREVVGSSWQRWPASGATVVATGQARAAIEHDRDTHLFYEFNGAELSGETTVAAGDNRYLLAAVVTIGIPAIRSVSHAGTALGFIGGVSSPGGNCQLQWWGLVAPGTRDAAVPGPAVGGHPTPVGRRNTLPGRGQRRHGGQLRAHPRARPAPAS